MDNEFDFEAEFQKFEKNITNIEHKFTKNGLDVPKEIEKTKKYLLG